MRKGKKIDVCVSCGSFQLFLGVVDTALESSGEKISKPRANRKDFFRGQGRAVTLLPVSGPRVPDSSSAVRKQATNRFVITK